MNNPFEGFEATRLMPLAKALRGYHNHKVYGMIHIPEKGGAIVASNHSLATYDLFMLYAAIYEETGRLVRPLMDRLFSKIPYVAEFMEALGARVGDHRIGKRLLKSGELIALAPGGMMESLRPSHEKYKIAWEERKGFVKLAINAQVPIILTACPKSDDIYDVYENKLTKLAYNLLKVPVPFAKGVGFTPIPKPVELIHLISEPIHPPVKDPQHAKKQLNDFHKAVVKRMNDLMEEALEKNP